MTNILAIITIIGVLINVVLLIMLLSRRSPTDQSQLKDQLEPIEKSIDKMERSTREEIAKNREELSKTVTSQFSAFTQLNEQKLEKIRSVVEERLKSIQDDSSQKLEKMRETVDEKLHSTLEKRLSESFKLVSERLEKVHQGLGEMQSLAAGVGDLKKILANVKTKGTFGEGQLENILSDILSPDQYEKNVVTKKGTRDPVEFAIRIIGDDDSVEYLPIDSKFPSECYLKLQAAQEIANLELIETAGKELESQIKLQAKTIRDKYIDPPRTTDYAIMFLVTESLYAEVMRRPGLAETVRRNYHVTIVGPTNLAAILISFRMAFRKIAVQKRATEVWNVLSVIKTEFGKFGDILDKTHKKLTEAAQTIEDAQSKTRNIEQKLKNVQELPSGGETTALIEEKTIDIAVKKM